MEKKSIRNQQKAKTVMSERQIMAELKHPYILSMQAAFQTVSLHNSQGKLSLFAA